MSGPAGPNKNFETNLLDYEARQLDEKLQKFFALHEFLRLSYEQLTVCFVCDILHKLPLVIFELCLKFHSPNDS